MSTQVVLPRIMQVGENASQDIGYEYCACKKAEIRFIGFLLSTGAI